MRLDPWYVLKWWSERVWPWIALGLVLGVMVVVVMLPVSWALDIGPFADAPDSTPAVAAPDPCCECEADLAWCEAEVEAWREQAVRCVDDVVEVHRR